jgi:hypothetical protein
MNPSNPTPKLTAFIAGAAVVLWVGAGYLGASPLALTMTALIAAVYLAGALELRRFQQATDGLDRALTTLDEAPPELGAWLARLPAPLQNAVRLRVEGARVGLPGPALTPYLVGLLVLLGMLGTFLGMVVTLKGAVMALESTTDLPTIRAALAAPVQGLGLAFGTSVAGVAASAMLGLMSALCRRDRQRSALRLDTRIATTLRPHSLAHQREQTLHALQAQARLLPALVDRLDAMSLQLDQRSGDLHGRLLAGQDRFHQQAQAAYADLAAQVGRSLQDSLGDGARAAGEVLQPAVEAAMSGIARESAAFHGRLADTVGQQLDALAGRFGATVDTVTAQWARTLAAQQADTLARDQQRLAVWTRSLEASAATLQHEGRQAVRAAAELVGDLRQKLSDSLLRDQALLDERSRIMSSLGDLLEAVNHAATGQRAAVDALVASSTVVLQQAATQISGGAVEVASLGEAFGHGVQLFSESSTAMTTQLARVEAALARSTARSDEQLAYYVAQARELIDLSLSSQKQIVEDLQQLQLAQRPSLSAEAA